MQLVRREVTVSKGRKPHLSPEGYLGLVLVFFRSQCEHWQLALWFGILPSSVSECLSLGLFCLHETLKGVSAARVEWPQEATRIIFSRIIESRFPTLQGAFGFVDGCRWEIEACASDSLKENAYYNGWTSTHNIANLFVFGPDGCGMFYVINCPGSWNDSRVARDGNLYDVLRLIPDREYLIADSIFPTSDESRELMGGQKIRRPPKANETQPESASELKFMSDLVSARQTAEWGIAGVTRSFPRVKKLWRWNSASRNFGSRRKELIETIIFLHNFRARSLGLNQIRSVWYSNLYFSDISQ